MHTKWVAFGALPAFGGILSQSPLLPLTLWGVKFCKIWHKTFAQLKNLALNIDKVSGFFSNTLIIIILFFVGGRTV